MFRRELVGQYFENFRWNFQTEELRKLGNIRKVSKRHRMTS